MSFVPILAAMDKDIEDMIAGMLVFFIIILIVALVIAIMYLLTLQKALARCSPRNRLMEPGMVWLNLIPCFNIVWQFITVNRVSASLQNEFRDRGLREQGDFGAGIGVAYCVLNLAGLIPYIGVVLSIGAFICWVIYWVKIAGYSSTLANDYGGGRRDRWDDEYDDDDRPRRSSRRDRDDERDYDDRDDDRPRRRRDEDDDDEYDRPYRR